MLSYHLFDGGFISFKDNGDLLISPKLSMKARREWGIPFPLNVGNFNKNQKIYLRYHRHNCLTTVLDVDK